MSIRFAIAGALATAALVSPGSALAADFVEAVRADRLHGQGITGEGVVVAVIDSGIDPVADLQGTVIKEVAMTASAEPGDEYGHGTFVAGLIHQTAPGVKFVSVKLSGADGAVDTSQVLAALQWVVSHKDQYGIDVVNLSFGSDSKQSARTSLLNYAVQRAWDSGLVVVTSAGNMGGGAGSVTKPGDDPVIITVGSSDHQGTKDYGDDFVPTFVSRGPTQDGLQKSDLVAPGKSLISTRSVGSTVDNANPQARISETQFRGSGTSFSTGIVSGGAALLLQRQPNLQPDQVKYLLMASANQINGDATAQGSGAMNLERATRLALGKANGNAWRSNGSGKVEQDRGHAHVVHDATVDTRIAGELTMQLRAFNHEEFVNGEWSASSWANSQWTASSWAASSWAGDAWEASSWGASSWGASSWGSSQWWASSWG